MLAFTWELCTLDYGRFRAQGKTCVGVRMFLNLQRTVLEGLSQYQEHKDLIELGRAFYHTRGLLGLWICMQSSSEPKHMRDSLCSFGNGDEDIKS